MKCNRCKLAIDTTKEAHVVMPNSEQCGYQRRRPTAFAHASCFERDVVAAYKQRLESEEELQREIAETRRHGLAGAGLCDNNGRSVEAE